MDSGTPHYPSLPLSTYAQMSRRIAIVPQFAYISFATFFLGLPTGLQSSKYKGSGDGWVATGKGYSVSSNYWGTQPNGSTQKMVTPNGSLWQTVIELEEHCMQLPFASLLHKASTERANAYKCFAEDYQTEHRRQAFSWKKRRRLEFPQISDFQETHPFHRNISQLSTSLLLDISTVYGPQMLHVTLLDIAKAYNREIKTRGTDIRKEGAEGLFTLLRWIELLIQRFMSTTNRALTDISSQSNIVDNVRDSTLL
ncbi:hypothetical protein PROFUN_04011 [Planoprotostelium fungivorum]|uniref:Uncharacterized protein n=1 Tax=Planoprotostelium fungivorum TaxID=1890364 RepID=A0A2P6NWD3_9EUKA|nr:hypothetical protein PROFUN_04011 [Planoprotostelium fungivorum]